ncbi:MAG: S46 family peptidase [Bacteroidales bacterium]|nr:S46 family peptidase [Bacteroidales bacterium]
MVDQIRKSQDAFYKDFNLATDKKVSAAIFKLYDENVPADFHPDFLKAAKTKYKGDFAKYVDVLYKKSFMVDRARTEAFLNKTNCFSSAQRTRALKLNHGCYICLFCFEFSIRTIRQ